MIRSLQRKPMALKNWVLQGAATSSSPADAYRRAYDEVVAKARQPQGRAALPSPCSRSPTNTARRLVPRPVPGPAGRAGTRRPGAPTLRVPPRRGQAAPGKTLDNFAFGRLPGPSEPLVRVLGDKEVAARLSGPTPPLTSDHLIGPRARFRNRIRLAAPAPAPVRKSHEMARIRGVSQVRSVRDLALDGQQRPRIPARPANSSRSSTLGRLGAYSTAPASPLPKPSP